MEIKNSQQLISLIKKKSEMTGLDPMVLQRHFMMDCFLARLAKSAYKKADS
jgi:hypothetical protein